MMRKVELYKVLFSLIEENKKLNNQIKDTIQFIDKFNITDGTNMEMIDKGTLLWIYQNFMLKKINDCEKQNYLNILKPNGVYKGIDFEKKSTLSEEDLKLLGYKVDINMFIEKTKEIANNEYYQFLNQNNSSINGCHTKDSVKLIKNKGIHIEEYSDIIYGKFATEEKCVDQILAVFCMNYNTVYLGPGINYYKNYESFFNYLIPIEELPVYWKNKIDENSQLKLYFDFQPAISENISELIVENNSTEYILIKCKNN